MSPAASDALVFFGATGNLAGENVEVAAWRIVGPALGCSTPVHEHEPGAWGPPGGGRAHRARRRLALPVREGGRILTARAGSGTAMTRSHGLARLAHAILGAWIGMLAPMSAPSPVAAQTPAAPAEIKRRAYQVADSTRTDRSCAASISDEDGRRLGQLDLLANYRITRHLLGYLGYSHFFTGAFINQSGPGRDSDFVYAALQYTF